MFSTLHSNRKGFTLIELMIVVVIIGILAALAIPRFMRASTKSKQSEAKQILKQVYVMEQAYRQEHDVYFPPTGTTTAIAGGVFTDIGVEIMAAARYTYVITGGTNTFSCVATSGVLDDDATNDVWQIDHLGTLAVTTDDAVN